VAAAAAAALPARGRDRARTTTTTASTRCRIFGRGQLAIDDAVETRAPPATPSLDDARSDDARSGGVARSMTSRRRPRSDGGRAAQRAEL
jgi:hypothetical protein